MAIACISDIHAGGKNSIGYKTLLDFLNHPLVAQSSHVAFLGDVFDHLTGEHREYLEKYSEFFQAVILLIQKGIKIHFVEGNHDFHFQKTFSSFVEQNGGEGAMGLFSYHRGGFELGLGGKRVWLCHGDELDLENPSYRRWKAIYSSRQFGWFISRLMPFSMVEKIGEKASKNSKERGRKAFDFSREKAKYRLAAQEFLATRAASVLVCGHTHIADEHAWDSGAYYNIGFPPKDRSFLYLNENEIVRAPLDIRDGAS